MVVVLFIRMRCELADGRLAGGGGSRFMHLLGYSRATKEELQNTLQCHVDQTKRDAAYYVLSEWGEEVMRDGAKRKTPGKSNLKEFDKLEPLHDTIEEMQVVMHAANLARITHTDRRITWCVRGCTLTTPRAFVDARQQTL